MPTDKVSLANIKKELQHLSTSDLIEACISLAKFKRENKELLSFILFDAHHLDGFITAIQTKITHEFMAGNFSYYYVAKKSLRKILKYTTQQIKFTKDKRAEVEILIHFCKKMLEQKLLHLDTTIDNMYASQLKKINKAMDTMHEDLQYDYKRTVQSLVEEL
jgi:hypothetical protein